MLVRFSLSIVTLLPYAVIYTIQYIAVLVKVLIRLTKNSGAYEIVSWKSSPMFIISGARPFLLSLALPSVHGVKGLGRFVNSP